MAAAHEITVDGSGLPAGTLEFKSMTGTEELGRPFAYELELVSANETLAFAKLVGKPLAVHVAQPGGGTRHFHGLVTRFAQVGWEGRLVTYRATLRPSLWLLGRKAGCRIFQSKSVPDILRAVLGEYGFPLQVSTSGSYPAREYVVQYRETDLDFVSRLMEQEGIYYFFRHEAGKHTLVLADAGGAHQAAAGYGDVPFFPPQEGEKRERDHVDGWAAAQQIESTACAFRDYDFTRPRANLEVKRAGGGGGGSPELEIYDYPGGYVQNGEGERYARTRLEEHTAQHERCEGAGNARGLAAGNLFKLKGHPRQDQNREYLLVAVSCELKLAAYESASSTPGAGEPVFRCRFVAQPSATPFRSPSLTPRPVVRGPQTARVVGKAGEEIWTDKYGRVKLQFHWDRASPGDENSSCWVRVAQGWAGGGWGAMHVPRLGEEVVVEFLEGDPDRPLVTGHLHEADHMPPWALPANQTQSGLRSHSTKGGGSDNFNELRFEDKKGEEQVYLQAEKNSDVLVKNDATTTINHDAKREVKNDETYAVGRDRVFSVGRDETSTIKRNRTETVEGDEGITVKGKRTEAVDKDEAITISGARTLAVTKNSTTTVDGARSLSVKKDETIDVGQGRTETVGKDASLTISGGHTVSVSKDQSVTVSGARNTSVSKDDVLTVDKKLMVSAADQIVLESGSAKIVLKKNGDIVLEGKDIKLDASGKITINASGDVVVKGSNVKQN